jgi:hypothetical protein
LIPQIIGLIGLIDFILIIGMAIHGRGEVKGHILILGVFIVTSVYALTRLAIN